jgi:hypothetical protein
MVIPASALAGVGWTGNTLSARLQTVRFNPTESGIQGIPISDYGNEPRIVFYYGATDVVPSDAEGFNYEFDLNFGS